MATIWARLKQYDEQEKMLWKEERKGRLREKIEEQRFGADKPPQNPLEKKKLLQENRAKANLTPASCKKPVFSAYNRAGKAVKSKDTIPKSVDRAMGNSGSKNSQVKPGISRRYGPVDEMNGDDPSNKPTINGDSNAKRKSRSSAGNSKNYKEASSESEEERPQVCQLSLSVHYRLTLQTVQEEENQEQSGRFRL